MQPELDMIPAPRYEIRNGDVVLVRHRLGAAPCEEMLKVQGELAVLADLDGGVLVKYGDAARVQKEYELMRPLERTGLFKLWLARFPKARITQALLEEINACIATSGRAKNLPQRIAALVPDAA